MNQTFYSLLSALYINITVERSTSTQVQHREPRNKWKTTLELFDLELSDIISARTSITGKSESQSSKQIDMPSV